MGFIVGVNDEPGNFLGPWTKLGSASDEGEARAMAKEMALREQIHQGSGRVVMAWEDGACPKWACTVEDGNLTGGWAPSLDLPLPAETINQS